MACSCVAAAIHRLNLLDGALSCDTLLQLMANVLDIDLVRLSFDCCVVLSFHLSVFSHIT